MENKDFRLKDYLACVARIALLEPIELESALRACAAGQATARRLLEERHLPHVVAYSLPYRSSGEPFLRLIESGNRALLRTVKRWNDPKLGAAAFLDALQVAVEQACEELLKTRA